MDMYSITPSYVKLEYIKKWSQLLLAWINKCITIKKVNTLNVQNIRDAIEKYKEDLTQESVDEMVHCGDVEVLLDFKYPGLKLRKYNNAEDYPRKVYIMTSALLFYLCVNSRNGQVINDICNRLLMPQQEILLRFCENLKDTAISYHTIEMAIAESIESAARDSIKADLLQGETSCFGYSLESSKISPTPTRNVKLKSQPSVLIQVNPSEYSRSSDPRSDVVSSVEDTLHENTVKDPGQENVLKDQNKSPDKALTDQDKDKTKETGQKKIFEEPSQDKTLKDLNVEKPLKEPSKEMSLDSQSQVKKTLDNQSQESNLKSQSQVETKENRTPVNTSEEQSLEKTLVNKSQDKIAENKIKEVTLKDQSQDKNLEEKTQEKSLADPSPAKSLENQVQAKKFEDQSKTTIVQKTEVQSKAKVLDDQAKVLEDQAKTLDNKILTQNSKELSQGKSLDGQSQSSTLKDKSEESNLKDKSQESTLKDKSQESTLKEKSEESTLKDKSQETVSEGQIQKIKLVDQSQEKNLVDQSQEKTLVDQSQIKTLVEQSQEKTLESQSLVTSEYQSQITSENQSQVTTETQSQEKSFESPPPVRTIKEEEKNVNILNYVQPEQSILYSQTSCFGCSMDKGQYGPPYPRGDKSVKSNPSILVQVNPNEYAQNKDKSQIMTPADLEVGSADQKKTSDTKGKEVTLETGKEKSLTEPGQEKPLDVKGQGNALVDQGKKRSSKDQAQSAVTIQSSDDKGQKSSDTQGTKSSSTEPAAISSSDAQGTKSSSTGPDTKSSSTEPAAISSSDAQGTKSSSTGPDTKSSSDAQAQSGVTLQSSEFKGQKSSDGQSQVSSSFYDQQKSLEHQGQEGTMTMLKPESGFLKDNLGGQDQLSPFGPREPVKPGPAQGLEKSVKIQETVAEESDEDDDTQACDARCSCGVDSCVVQKLKEIPNECLGAQQWTDPDAETPARKPSAHPEDDLAGRIPTCPRRGRFECTKFKNRRHEFIAFAFVVVLSILFTIFFFLFDNTPVIIDVWRSRGRAGKEFTWQCVQDMCKKLQQTDTSETYTSRSRCELLCANPPLWPQPTGETTFSREIVALTTKNLEYKFASTVSSNVQTYLSEAFKLFLSDLDKLESTIPKKTYGDGFEVLNVNINIDVTTDPNHKLRLNTDESYYLEIFKDSHLIQIKIVAASFSGARHGLETLRQLILLDLYTGYLITLSQATIQDAPFNKVRGLMISTNKFIPLNDMVRTLDAMAMSKFNTFHWRMPLTVFRFLIPTLSEVFDALVYTKQYVENLVQKADSLGIRILIEVASSDEPGGINQKINNCENAIKSQTPVFVGNLLSVLHENTLEMTAVNDMFHMSSIFSSSSCFEKKERKHVLRIVLDHLQLVNHGVFPKMPIIWNSDHFEEDFEEGYEEHLTLQVTTWPDEEEMKFMNTFNLIFSINWDLSCELVSSGKCTKFSTWQEMYASRSFPEDLANIVGGEALLWTDMLKEDESMEEIIWPRAAAVGERLWSFSAVSPVVTDTVAQRLDLHRLRMIERHLIANELSESAEILREEPASSEPTPIEPDYDLSKNDKT